MGQREVIGFKASPSGRRLDTPDASIGLRGKLVDGLLVVIVIRDGLFYFYALEDNGSLITMTCADSEGAAFKACMNQIEARGILED